MIRELPRGKAGVYLHAHYQAPAIVTRFAMGCGAIFMVQRVRPQADSLIGPGAIAETDPMLLEEMVALVAQQGLDVVPLAEVRRRLSERDLSRRFVAFTFDGAYKTTLASIVPLFRQRGLPFALFAGTDFLDTGRLPWWLTLEALVRHSESIRIYSERKTQHHASTTDAEKRDCFAKLFRELSQIPSAERLSFAEQLCREHGIDLAASAEKEMVSAEDLRALAADPLVTVGSQAGGIVPLSEMSLDEARDTLALSLNGLETTLGSRLNYVAYPGMQAQSAGAREFLSARSLGLEAAVTAVEGALWPEHAGELFALPRIALDNDPATLVRALMLSGGSSLGSGVPGARQAIA